MKKLSILLSLFLFVSCQSNNVDEVENHKVDSLTAVLEKLKTQAEAPAKKEYTMVDALMDAYEMGYDDGIEYGKDATYAKDNGTWKRDSTKMKFHLDTLYRN